MKQLSAVYDLVKKYPVPIAWLLILALMFIGMTGITHGVAEDVIDYVGIFFVAVGLAAIGVIAGYFAYTILQICLCGVRGFFN